MGTGDDGPDESAYATAVEDAFISERGTPFLLSPKDWRVIREWHGRKIPLETVVTAVRESFERRRKRGAAGKISSISYCAGAVEERWEMERHGLVGARREAPEEGCAGRIERLRETFAAASRGAPEGFDRATFRSASARALDRLLAVDDATGFDGVEEALSALEASLLRALGAGLTPEARTGVEARVDAALSESSGLPSSAMEKVRCALERREVRRLAGLPPLTLFGGLS